jgi:glucokinase
MPDPQALIKETLTHANWGILGNQGHILGVDLGGYGLRAVLIDLQHHTYAQAHIDGQGATPQAIVDEALQMCRSLLEQNNVRPDRLIRIGVGFGGPVDPDRGKVRFSPRMSGWENFQLQNTFERAFDTVTLIDNDANLIALGEATFGAGKECANLFYLHLSSGVGGGIVIDKRLYHGATATAGEIGHAVALPYEAQSDMLPTLEALVSIRGILERANTAGLSTDNLHDIFSEHAIGKQIVDETTHMLAIHLAQVVALLDPQLIVLGGIVSRIGGNSFRDAIAQQMNNYLAPEFASSVHIVPTKLGMDSVAIGAMAMALESLQE